MKILEIQHVNEYGEIIWEDKNINNLLHAGGELFVLTCCFANDGSLPPSQYYLGLDNRPVVSIPDLLTGITGEPDSNGYFRQSVSSSSGFTISPVNEIYTASTSVVTFSATTGDWGPVKNLFLATTNDSSGVLLATAALSSTRTVTAGNSINLRMLLSLQDVSA
jgi:hypothetical protein